MGEQSNWWWPSFIISPPLQIYKTVGRYREGGEADGVNVTKISGISHKGKLAKWEKNVFIPHFSGGGEYARSIW